MDSKICVVCNIEKSIDNYYNKYRECKQCNIKRSMKRYNENKDFLLARSKLYQQNRIPYTQQIKDLNNKIEELTQTLETIILKNE